MQKQPKLADTKAILHYSLVSPQKIINIKITQDTISYAESSHTNRVSFLQAKSIDQREIKITNHAFVEMVRDTIIRPYRNQMKQIYDKVQGIPNKDLRATKSQPHETLIIHDNDFNATINMNIANYGHIFHDFINALKKIIEIQANNRRAFSRFCRDTPTSISHSIVASPARPQSLYELDYDFIDTKDVRRILRNQNKIAIR